MREERRVWICLVCKAGVPAMDGGIERHYRRNHKLRGPVLQTRSGILAAAVDGAEPPRTR